MDEQERAQVQRYVGEAKELAKSLNVSVSCVLSVITLRRLDVLSRQLFNQGYRGDYEHLLDERGVKVESPQQPLWGSPATSQRLVD